MIAASLLLLCSGASALQYGTGSYILHGQVSLPYASIVEPVTVWTQVSATQGLKQRIDYYGGQDSYFMFPSTGKSYEIVPTDYTTSCFMTSNQPGSVEFQTFFPDLSTFEQIASGIIVNQKACDQYQRVEIQFNKTNTYNFYVNPQDNSPVQFHFIGYDELLGSHYDEYVFDYFKYQEGEVQQGVFDKLESFLSSNSCPMLGSYVPGEIAPTAKLFPFGPDSFVEEHFDAFKERHGKQYESEVEHRLRLQTYHNNLRYIASVNRQKKGYELAVNHLADRFEYELRSLHPSKGRSKPNNAMYTFSSVSSKLPESVDWRTAGAVSDVKDQGICGSCWSFGAAETIEGTLFLRTGVMARLSSQALVDCSWSFGNMGCDGGNDFLGYEWIMKSGYIPTEASYPYTMADGYCKYETAQPGVSIKGYVNVTSGDAQALREALATHGPISVSIDASHKSFSFYKSGIYYEPQCGNGLADLDHTVLAVGYGVENGTPYWIVKNSWSTYWGDEGYIKMSAVNNNCGVATQPTFVVI
eukprot:TRINITY_DN2192_c0_g1_i1.p1 TRINITY_DN2192_c0_g1~~TRINITY_DN2192_c0_g1_i1.p1  ORF type:complete len:527 (-),score=129.86 TRINITY_DN2192_c0_g1_i1:78-1658(-)